MKRKMIISIKTHFQWVENQPPLFDLFSLTPFVLPPTAVPVAVFVPEVVVAAVVVVVVVSGGCTVGPLHRAT